MQTFILLCSFHVSLGYGFPFSAREEKRIFFKFTLFIVLLYY